MILRLEFLKGESLSIGWGLTELFVWMGQMLLLSGGDSESAEKPSAFANAVGVFASFNRFMRSLSQ